MGCSSVREHLLSTHEIQDSIFSEEGGEWAVKKGKERMGAHTARELYYREAVPCLRGSF